MQLILPVPEALALASAVRPFPPLIHAIRGVGDALVVEVDAREIPDAPLTIRLAAAAAGVVTVTLRYLDCTAGTVRFGVTASARALPVHKLLPHLTGPITAGLRDAGLPEGLVEIRRTEGEPDLLVRVQEAVDAKVGGLTLTDCALVDGALRVTATVGTVTRR